MVLSYRKVNDNSRNLSYFSDVEREKFPVKIWWKITKKQAAQRRPVDITVYFVAQFPVAEAVRKALMKPSRSPSITALMLEVSWAVRLSFTS